MENVSVYNERLYFAEKDGKVVARKNRGASVEYSSSTKTTLVEYCLYAKGCFCISFSARNYSRTGAIARAQNLAKSFFNVRLISLYSDGIKEKVWPIVTKRK